MELSCRARLQWATIIYPGFFSLINKEQTGLQDRQESFYPTLVKKAEKIPEQDMRPEVEAAINLAVFPEQDIPGQPMRYKNGTPIIELRPIGRIERSISGSFRVLQ